MRQQPDEDPVPTLPKKARGIILGVIAILLFAGIVLPNIAIRADPPGIRVLPTTSIYFLTVTSDKLPGSDPNTVGFGLTVTFFALAIWQFGLLLTFLTAWTLASAEQHRWLWVLVMIGAITVAIAPPTLVLGKLFLDQAGASASLGIAWLPSFVGGVALVIWTAHANRMIDRTWYEAKPELIT